MFEMGELLDIYKILLPHLEKISGSGGPLCHYRDGDGVYCLRPIVVTENPDNTRCEKHAHGSDLKSGIVEQISKPTPYLMF